MTKLQALELADRLLNRHLALALVNFQDSLTAQGTDPHVAAERLGEYGRDLAAWKQRSLIEIEQKLTKNLETVH